MRWFTLTKIYLVGIFFINPCQGYSQNFLTDTSGKISSFQRAVNLYHRFLSPETGLYDGSEYAYNAYYPFTINEGHPFFQSKNFDTGSVFYNNVLYEKVPLLFDIIKEEVLIHDPTRIYIIRLNNESIRWFTIWGHTFIRLKMDSNNNTLLHTGFYDVLYKGNTVLYKKVSKIFKENSASSTGINKYVVELDEYFIKKNKKYYKVKNKKSLLLIVNDRKKEIAKFIKKNKLNIRKNKDDALTKILAYYDAINMNNNTKTIN